MKMNLLPAIRLTIATLVLFCVVYPAVVWGIAQLAPNNGKGEVITVGGKRYYANVGQQFTEDRYFNSRPSAVDYNAAGSAGSNKGPSNPDYLQSVQTRLDTFLLHNPGVQKNDVPVELVTASGSGLDPDISEQGARVQAARIAKVRGISETAVKELIAKHTEGPLLGLFGPAHINVLKLNLALDQLK
ncbi:potassium-transporting ATPase KdpC subunit [Dyadobacter beijingensis]|uniref:Potassium-transporting ATPase KdpC subunit n=1 Tax=Dyadobacter beijingensis TaxID=365489 RepID=A0ABQ2IA25_9BACT|nr:K(+)-transporting ATPase subunit C [Dyadobacter beijingensis]GGN03826.1 potassium-transporting ATPase KdpC subunit [Dyadobacter beijingensis]